MSHLKNIKMSYLQHFARTMNLLFIFQKLSLVAIIHGLFPNLFISTISSKIRQLDKESRLREAKLKCCQNDCSCQK